MSHPRHNLIVPLGAKFTVELVSMHELGGDCHDVDAVDTVECELLM